MISNCKEEVAIKDELKIHVLQRGKEKDMQEYTALVSFCERGQYEFWRISGGPILSVNTYKPFIKISSRTHAASVATTVPR